VGSVNGRGRCHRCERWIEADSPLRPLGASGRLPAPRVPEQPTDLGWRCRARRGTLPADFQERRG